MIGKLRKKFIFITMILVFFILAFVLGCINVVNIYQNSKKTSEVLSYLMQEDAMGQHNNGMPPENDPQKEETQPPQKDSQNPAPDNMPPEERRFPGKNPEAIYTTRYFSVNINESGQIVNVNTEFIAAISKEEAEAYGYQVRESGRESGYIGRYKYAVASKPDGMKIVFLDCDNEISSCVTVAMTSFAVGITSYLLLFLLIAAFSKKAVQPVIENIEKQKQFISDAGHELKTPIAIISANADVLSLTTPENQWIRSIKNQTKRMDDLVRELLMLNRIEEKKDRKRLEDISLSDIAKDMVDSFRILADKTGRILKAEIEPNLMMKGDKNEIRNIFSVLLDNAIKYSLPESEIKVCVKQERRKYQIVVQNKCEPIKEGNLDQMFERFYRLDSSRSRETGGFGIGLSIAKEAVRLHKGSISVDYTEKEGIRFIVKL